MAVRHGGLQEAGGSIYAVPFGAGYYYTVFYNTKVFARANITTLPTTLAGLIADARDDEGEGHHAVRVR